MTRFTDENDSTLVDLTLLGNDEAYEELVTRHENKVKAVAYRVTGNTYSAEDAAQDAFVCAWMKLDRLREHDKFSSWICTIAGNTARNLAEHYRNTAADMSLDIALLSESDEDDSPEIALIADSEGDELHEAVDSLSGNVREAVRLHYFDGLSVKEIAEVLSLAQGTVKWCLSEGRKQLRKGYGIMEKTYDENEKLVRRVMRQVEKLKLWQLKADKTGFEEEYREVLSAVESLNDSKEKDYVLCEVLLRGYWWLPGEKNDETFCRIRESAEKSHNDEVMADLLCYENEKHSGEDKLKFMLEKIEWLEKNDYPKSLGYELFWCAYEFVKNGRKTEAITNFRRVLDVLEPSDVYYANALAALKTEEIRGAVNYWDKKLRMSASGEQIKRDGEKLYFMTQPGYGGTGYCDSLFFNLSCFDLLLFDRSVKPGDFLTSSDGKLTYTVKIEKESVTVPAGTFHDCTVIGIHGLCHKTPYDSETWLCPGIGIVKQKTEWYTKGEWVLADYSVIDENSTELLPFDKGNTWNYSLIHGDDELLLESENVFEVIHSDKDKSVISHCAGVRTVGYDKSSVIGNAAFIRHNYCKRFDDRHETLDNREEVFDSLKQMQKAAKTDYEKNYAKICGDVTKRIFDTDPEANPDYTEKGIWNFFEEFTVDESDNSVKVIWREHYHIEWKDTATMDFDGSKLLHAFIYDVIQENLDSVWSDEWTPGYHHLYEQTDWQENKRKVTLDVLENETVTTAAGTFPDCRHIRFVSEISDYRGGTVDLWYAEHIGLVRLSRETDKKRDNVYDLTAYEGTGEGYFPAKAGLFRRYEPTDLQGGWHARSEYTFAEKDGEVRILHDVLGTRDRAEYEASIAPAEEK